MVDKVDSQTRSKMMSRVRNKNTNIEVKVRKALFAKGFRYKINDKNLPGSPDIVLPKYKAAIFVNGCFWHGHDCSKGQLPKSNIEYWKTKIIKNKKRDVENIEKLLALGWKVATIWECALKGRNSIPLNVLISQLEHWITFGRNKIDISGQQN